MTAADSRLALPDPVLDRIVGELLDAHAAHTVLLYGSRAQGTHRADSDYDIAAFGPGRASLRIARAAGDAFLDVFVYAENVLDTPSQEYLRLRASQVLVDQAGKAGAFLQRLDELYSAGPGLLPADEVEMRQVWASKMLQRAAHGDPEGNYRRAWLLTALLEDVFAIRGMWFEGPKKALAWLQVHDRRLFEAYSRALLPGAPLEHVRDLVLAAYGPR